MWVLHTLKSEWATLSNYTATDICTCATPSQKDALYQGGARAEFTVQIRLITLRLVYTLQADADRHGNGFCVGCSKSCTQAAPGKILLSSEHHWWVNNQPPGSSFLWLLSAALFLSPSLLIPCLAHYNSLTHYHALHLTCSLGDFHIQPRSMGLLLIVRLTPFTSCSLHSVSLTHLLSILLQPRFITAICQCSCLASWHILWQPIRTCCC